MYIYEIAVGSSGAKPLSASFRHQHGDARLFLRPVSEALLRAEREVQRGSVLTPTPGQGPAVYKVPPQAVFRLSLNTALQCRQGMFPAF